MNVTYLFEDSSGDSIQELFKKGFPKSISDNFEYSDGNRNLVAMTKNILNADKTDLLAVYIDFVPNNVDTANVFNDICKLALELYIGKIIPIPVLGSEYYYIKSVSSKPIVKDMEIIRHYLDVKPYGDIVTAWAKKYKIGYSRYSTYERLGKRLIEHNFYTCISSPESDIRDYNNMDCICKKQPYNGTCTDMLIADKAADFVKQYPIIPSGAINKSKLHSIDLKFVFNYSESMVGGIVNKAATEFNMSEEALIIYNKSIEYIEKVREQFKC